MTYNFLLFGPGLARGFDKPSGTAPSGRLTPALGPPGPLRLLSSTGIAGFSGSPGVGVVFVSDLMSVGGGDSLGGFGVEVIEVDEVDGFGWVGLDGVGLVCKGLRADCS